MTGISRWYGLAREAASLPSVHERLKELEHVLQTVVHDKPRAEIDSKLSEAFERLVAGMNSCDESVVRLGSFLAVKHTLPEGKTRLSVLTLTARQMIPLGSHPELLQSPT